MSPGMGGMLGMNFSFQTTSFVMVKSQSASLSFLFPLSPISLRYNPKLFVFKKNLRNEMLTFP